MNSKEKADIKEHVHIGADGKAYTHIHGDENGHEHKHVHQNTKAILNRIAKATGHLDSVKRMIEDGRDCSDVLVQLAAVIAALKNTGKVILQDHIEHCIVEAIESNDRKAIDDLNKAIGQFIK